MITISNVYLTCSDGNEWFWIHSFLSVVGQSYNNNTQILSMAIMEAEV